MSTDSTCDLSQELISRHDIAIIPLYVNFGTQTFKDNLDITAGDLFRKVKETGKLPMTSAPTVGDFTAAFEKYINQEMDILHISISSKISASYQNACMAAAELPKGRVKVIDSLNLSSGIGILVMSAAHCIEQGLNLEDIVQNVQSAISRARVEFIIDTVEYLHKGGRCSGLQMLLSSLLEIHPIIKVTDGSIHLAAKIRGNRQVVLRNLVKNALDKIDSINPERIFITHAECSEDATRVQTQFSELNKFKHVYVTNASCVISAHCGPKTIGIIYLSK